MSRSRDTGTVTINRFVAALYPFDTNTVALKIASGQGKTKDQVLAEWKQKKNNGIRFRALLQRLLHMRYNDTENYSKSALSLLPDVKFVYLQLEDFLTNHCQGWTLVALEREVRSPKGFKGTIDALFTNAAGEHMICEWKFGSKLWTSSFDGKKGLGPFGAFDNCKYCSASTQIALYRAICIDEGLNVTEMHIVHMNPEMSKYPTVFEPLAEIVMQVQKEWPLIESASKYIEEALKAARDAAKQKDSGLVIEPSSSESSIPYERVDDTKVLQNANLSQEFDINTSLSPDITLGTHSGTLSDGPSQAVGSPATDVMLDLETLSTEPNAHILTIGAIKFSRERESVPLQNMDTFYRRVSFVSNKELDMHKSCDTIAWWMKQSEAAKKEAFATEGRVDITDALEDFVKWFGDAKCIWSHGSSFDTVIIAEALKKCKIAVPFKFWNIRDTRTAYDLSDVKLADYTSKEKAHHALYDCYHQIEALRQCL